MLTLMQAPAHCMQQTGDMTGMLLQIHSTLHTLYDGSTPMTGAVISPAQQQLSRSQHIPANFDSKELTEHGSTSRSSGCNSLVCRLFA